MPTQTKKTGQKSHVKRTRKKRSGVVPTNPEEHQVINEPIVEPVVEQTAEISEQSDREIKPTTKPIRHGTCPKCGAFPTIKRIKRGNYELRRCRVCDHPFEINGE